MIDIQRARASFRRFLDGYGDQDEAGFRLKVSHTCHTAALSGEIAAKLGLSEEDIKLAELVALLHDIGRFEEIKETKRFDSAGFDHASCGVRILFGNDLIRDFIADSGYDEIIKNAVENHSRIAIRDGLDRRSLLHARIIRDADKLDNFRVKMEEKTGALFPGTVKSREEIEDSTLSDRVYEAVKNEKSVDIHDRVTPLDHWVCVLAFVFDLNFRESYRIMKEKRYIDMLIDKFHYNDVETENKMEEIRRIMNGFVDSRV